MSGIRFLDPSGPIGPRHRPPLPKLPGLDFDAATHHEEMLFGRNHQRRNELHRDWLMKKAKQVRKQLRPREMRARHRRRGRR